jgi:hypothetical protein
MTNYEPWQEQVGTSIPTNMETAAMTGLPIQMLDAEGALTAPGAAAPSLHPKTADLVARFARALSEKLAVAEVKYGYSDGWRDPAWMDECRTKLLEHVAKGDPRDVAAYCAFLWHHGEPTSGAAAPTPSAPDLDVIDELESMRSRKNAAYEERNKVVAALARLFPSGVKQTAIAGWSDDWHKCVYIDLPTGQVSWHFHDSQAHLFDGLPDYSGEWDGHDTPEKYRRLAALAAPVVPLVERFQLWSDLVQQFDEPSEEMVAQIAMLKTSGQVNGQPTIGISGAVAVCELLAGIFQDTADSIKPAQAAPPAQEPRPAFCKLGCTSTQDCKAIRDGCGSECVAKPFQLRAPPAQEPMKVNCIRREGCVHPNHCNHPAVEFCDLRRVFPAPPAQEPPTAPRWQSMETAPKDGTEVLLRVKLRAGMSGRCLVGHYMEGGHCIEDHPPIDRGWYFWSGSMFDRAAEPVEWMALPTAPAALPAQEPPTGPRECA